MPVVETLAVRKPVIAPEVGLCWRCPVLRYCDDAELMRIVCELRTPNRGWDSSAREILSIHREMAFVTQCFLRV